MNDENIKSIKLLAGAGIAILLMVFVAVIYSVFKTPVVTKSTIDSLVTSTQLTQQYVKELRDIAYANRMETHKDNDLLKHSGEDRDDNYKDLYDKYGTLAYDGNKQTVRFNPDPSPAGINGLQQQTKDIRRQ